MINFDDFVKIAQEYSVEDLSAKELSSLFASTETPDLQPFRRLAPSRCLLDTKRPQDSENNLKYTCFNTQMALVPREFASLLENLKQDPSITEEEGLFRVSSGQSIHSTCSAIKRFVRSALGLPLAKASARALIASLSPRSLHILYALLDLLSHLSLKASSAIIPPDQPVWRTRMDAHALAIVMAPNIFECSIDDLEMTISFTESLISDFDCHWHS